MIDERYSASTSPKLEFGCMNLISTHGEQLLQNLPYGGNACSIQID